jgi:iron complex transport system ATP-binding protein
MPAVDLHDVEVRIAGRRILGPLDLRVEQGERWMLLGPNGSGKTTLLTVIGAWRHPSGGTATVLGRRFGHTDLRALRVGIGHVSHAVADALEPGLTTIEVVLTGRESTLATWPFEVTASERAAATAALEDVGCAGLAEQAFLRCSQGERQRVLLARARFGRRELVLLDEPAAGLDLPGREALLGVLDGMAADGTLTAIMATHHLDEIPTSATHAALLRQGTLLDAGPVEDVLTPSRLETCFGLALRVERRAGRWFAFASSDGGGSTDAPRLNTG